METESLLVMEGGVLEGRVRCRILNIQPGSTVRASIEAVGGDQPWHGTFHPETGSGEPVPFGDVTPIRLVGR